jgi:hypothetical protein
MTQRRDTLNGYRDRLVKERDDERRLADDDDGLADWLDAGATEQLSHYQRECLARMSANLRKFAVERRVRADAHEESLNRIGVARHNGALAMPTAFDSDPRERPLHEPEEWAVKPKRGRPSATEPATQKIPSTHGRGDWGVDIATAQRELENDPLFKGTPLES